MFWNLWTGRSHLRAVCRKALGRPAALDESEEMMRYRTALIGLIASVIFAVFWLWRAGMGFGVSCLFVFATLVLYIGVSRVVSDVGLVFVSTPVGAQRFGNQLIHRNATLACQLFSFAGETGFQPGGECRGVILWCH